MATNRDVQDFVELRSGFQGMFDFADAALRFLDRHGIGGARRAITGNGNGHHASTNGHGPLSVFREQVKRKYTKRKKYAKRKNTKHVARPSSTEVRRHTREQSAALLETFDRVEPRKQTGKAIGSLVRRGYLRKKGDGYIRTAKEYVVSEPVATPEEPDSDNLRVKDAAKMLKISESYVRLLVKQKKLRAHKESRLPAGRKRLVPLMVLSREDVARYAAEQAGA